MIISLEDAGFWVNFTPIFWAYACLSADTEVLTDDGWKDWEHLRKSKICDIMVYDAERNQYHYETPERWQSYSVKDTCYRVKSDKTDQLVSRNHRCLIEREGKLLYRTPEEIKRERVPSGKFVYLENLPEVQELVHSSTVSVKENWESQSRDVLLNKLSPAGQCMEDYEVGQAHSYNVREAETTAARSNDRREELGLERWSDLLQNAWELCRCEICSLSERIFGYVTQRRLCYGASLIGSPTDRQTVIENGDSSPQRPRPYKQFAGQSSIVSEQPLSQAGRIRTSYQTTLATVTKEYYEGTVYCPTVSTGCFLARRNGKMFLTGNSGFPKAQNISKAVDKHARRDYVQAAMELGIKPTSDASWRDWTIGEHAPSNKYWEEFKKVISQDDWKRIEREVIGIERKRKRQNWCPTSDDNNTYTTKPQTIEAKELDGSYGGFQPKPSLEVVIVAMKPLQKTDKQKASLDFEQLRELKRCLINKG